MKSKDIHKKKPKNYNYEKENQKSENYKIQTIAVVIRIDHGVINTCF
jgi:hypothetical protein